MEYKASNSFNFTHPPLPHLILGHCYTVSVNLNFLAASSQCYTCCLNHRHLSYCTLLLLLVAKSCLTLLWHRWLQPSRLLRPWDFPGKSTGVGWHSFSKESSQPSSWTQALQCCGGFFTAEAPQKPKWGRYIIFWYKNPLCYTRLCKMNTYGLVIFFICTCYQKAFGFSFFLVIEGLLYSQYSGFVGPEMIDFESLLWRITQNSTIYINAGPWKRPVQLRVLKFKLLSSLGLMFYVR